MGINYYLMKMTIMPQDTITVSEYITAPGWVNAPKILRNMCNEFNVNITIEVNKGFLTETIWVEVKGVESSVNKVLDAIKRLETP